MVNCWARPIHVDDVVLVMSPKTPWGHWPLGQIIKVYPGKGDHVRVSKVQVGKEEFLRPILSSLCQLLELSWTCSVTTIMMKRGALAFSVLRIWPIFDLVFRFSLLIIAGFRFWRLVRFAGFLQFSLWFSVFVKNDGGFSDSSAQFILQFFWFCQGSHSHLAVMLKL